jgi:Asp-tRNA(Asn)/Glu-tRNA(Gln) amidotransferase A subunit family amidase
MLRNASDSVRSGRRSARSLIATALERIDAHNPQLNAVVRIRPEALDEADALDRQIAAGSSRALPLAGLPFLVKDVEDLAGFPTTHGSLLFADAPSAAADSGTVARLRAAGAIPVGKTNTSEFAFEGVTDNRLFGPTFNPWNLDWSPGGSSGGSAAAIAAGMVPIATGSDAGGSVRGPAAVCGLVGLKPTNGLIGRAAAPEWLDLVTDGVFGSRVDDVALLLSVLAGPAAGDTTAAPSWTTSAEPALPARLMYAPRIQPGPPLESELDALFRAAIEAMARDLHLPVADVAPDAIFPGDHHPDDDSLVLLGAETIAWLGRATVEARRADFDRHFAPYIDDALGVTLDDYLAARRRRFDHARRMDQLLGPDAVLVTPTLNIPGLLADGRAPGGASKENAMANTNPVNVTGHPAISLPAGRQSNGLPFGIQVIGPRYRDDLLLRLGEAWERIAPWPAAAPGYEPFAETP